MTIQIEEGERPSTHVSSSFGAMRDMHEMAYKAYLRTIQNALIYE
jgi:hypothetical protein